MLMTVDLLSITPHSMQRDACLETTVYIPRLTIDIRELLHSVTWFFTIIPTIRGVTILNKIEIHSYSNGCKIHFFNKVSSK